MARGRGRGQRDCCDEMCDAICDNPKRSSTIACGLIWFIVAVTLIAESFATIHYREYGLKYYGVSIQLDDSRYYTNGRYYVGVGNYFVKYPRSLLYIEFSNPGAADGTPPLDVWSKDGQNLYIEAGFYFRLRPEKLVELYYNYEGDSWRQIVKNIASETIRDVTTKYETIEFFTNRSTIDTDMQNRLATRLYQEIYCNLTDFNLLGIDVPENFDKAILQKTITQQDVKTSEKLRDSKLKTTTISIVNAQAQANITIINTQAEAEGLRVTTRVAGKNFQDYAAAKAQYLAKLATGLNFTDPKHLLQYVYTDLIRGSENPRASIMVDIPELMARI